MDQSKPVLKQTKMDGPLKQSYELARLKSFTRVASTGVYLTQVTWQTYQALRVQYNDALRTLWSI